MMKVVSILDKNLITGEINHCTQMNFTSIYLLIDISRVIEIKYRLSGS